MTFHFIDTSALIKLFIQEPGSAEMESFLTGLPEPMKVVSALAEIEARSALCRLFREGLLTEAELSALLLAVRTEIGKMVVQPIDEHVLAFAADLISSHYLRPLDAIQCASAIIVRKSANLGTIQFIASDRTLLKAAEIEGFTVWDPAASEAETR